MPDEVVGIHAVEAAPPPIPFGNSASIVPQHMGERWMAAGRPDLAIDPFLDAARVAMEDVRLAQAYELASRALECLSSLHSKCDPRSWEARLMLADVSACRGRYDLTLMHLDTAERECPIHSGTDLEVRVTWLRAQVADARRQMDHAIDLYTRLCDLCAAHDDRSCLCRALARLAGIRMDRGENDEASRLVHQAQSCAGTTSDRRVQGLVHLVAGRLARKQGDPTGTLVHCDLAIELLDGPKDYAERAEAIFVKGLKLLELGRLKEALATHHTGVAFCREVGYARGLAAHLANEGAALSGLGRLDEARVAAEQSLALREEAGDSAGVASCLIGLADIALSDKRWDEARSRSARALSLCRKIGFVSGRRVALMNLAKAELGKGDLLLAERWLLDCLDSLADEPMVTSQIAQAHSLIASLYDQRGEAEKANSHRNKAEDAYRQLGLDLAVLR